MLLTPFLSLFGAALLLVAIGLLLANLLGRQIRSDAGPVLAQTPSGPVFLFDEGRLIDCTPAARALLVQMAAQGAEWQGLMAFLSPRFPQIDEKIAQIATLGRFSDVSHNENGVATLVEVEFTGGLTKISLSDPDVQQGPGVVMAMAHRAALDEVAILRATLAASPVLAWRESPLGEVTWANAAYLLWVSGDAGQHLVWPLPRLFDQDADPALRQGLTRPDGTMAWFDHSSVPHGAMRLCFAVPADAAVKAETGLREFMQTLSKTFAHLPIGLAIFDRDRKLQMFNPALLDLTHLPADFLSMRPSLLSVLDAMRDRNLLPEPRNYQGWRKQIVDMEKAAEAGVFQENWTLTDGQTFRVTGRPHPNGALALMIEDISSEMQRTRRYRSDVELGHSVVDQMPEAIVVFDQSGQVLWCNTAYSQLWDHDPNATLTEATVRSLGAHWRSRSAPTKLWLEIDEFVHTVGDRAQWTADLRLTDGRLLSCRIAPVAAGATMVAFAGGAPLGQAAQKMTKKAG